MFKILSFSEKFRKKIENFDFFALGNSWLFYYLIMFCVLPLTFFLGLHSKIIEWLVNQNNMGFLLDFRAILYLSAGFIFFILGYYFVYPNFFFKDSFEFLKRQWRPKNVFFIFVLVFTANLVIKSIRILNGGYFHLKTDFIFSHSSFYSLIGLLDWLGPIALAISFIFYYHLLKDREKGYKFWRFLAWATFAFEFFYGFFSGSRLRAIIPIIIFLIVKHYVHKRSYKRVVIVAILIFFLLMPVMNLYRSNGMEGFNFWSSGNKSEVQSSNIQSFVIDSSVGRVSQTRVIHALFEKGDKFLYGKTLLNFFISLGPPQFIWKDKPAINANSNYFGRHVGVLNPDDFETSASPTVVGDWYMNFGIAGIILGMFLMGMLFRIIYNVLIKNASSLSGAMIYSILWIQIIKGMEDWIAPVWAGIVKMLVILLVITYFLGKNWDKSKV